MKRKLDAQLNTERGRLTQCFPKGAVAVRSEIDVIVTKRLPTFVVELGKTTSTRLNNVRDQLKKEAAVVSQDLEKSQVDLTNASDALAAAWKQLEV